MGKQVIGEIDANTDRLCRIGEARKTIAARAVDLQVAADEHKATKKAYDAAVAELLAVIDEEPMPLLDGEAGHE